VERALVQLEHEKLFNWLYRLIGDFVEDHDLGMLFGSRTAVEITEFRGRLPDLIFVRKDRCPGDRLSRDRSTGDRHHPSSETPCPDSTQTRSQLRSRRSYRRHINAGDARRNQFRTGLAAGRAEAVRSRYACAPRCGLMAVGRACHT
jgi:hypothetical protein